MVRSLDQVVDVDYYMPGCPPTPKLLQGGGRGAARGQAAARRARCSRRTSRSARSARARTPNRRTSAFTEFKRPHQTADRSREVPSGPGRGLHGPGHPRRVRRAVHQRQHALHRLLRPDLARAGTTAPRSSPRSAPTSTPRTKTEIDSDSRGDSRSGRHVLPLRAGRVACCGASDLPAQWKAAISEPGRTSAIEPGRQQRANADLSEARRGITIDPITRLEGHGKIDIFLDDKGEVERAYFQVPELRGFEVFSLGRPAEDMPQITSRICGVCPTAHHMAATKALDDLYKVEPPPAAAGRSASWSTTPSCSRTTRCTSTSSADRTSSSGPKRPQRAAQRRRRDSEGRRRGGQDGSSRCAGACAS